MFRPTIFVAVTGDAVQSSRRTVVCIIVIQFTLLAVVSHGVVLAVVASTSNGVMRVHVGIENAPVGVSVAVANCGQDRQRSDGEFFVYLFLF